MSSILKSLRKIEEKKRVSEHAAPDLTHDQGAGIAKANPFRPLLAGIALGAVMVGLLFYLFATPPAYISGPRPAAEPAALAATGQPARTATPNVQGQVETKPLPLANLAEKIPAAVQGSNPGSTVDAGQVPVVVLPPESIATSPPVDAEPSSLRRASLQRVECLRSRQSRHHDRRKSAPKIATRARPSLLPQVDGSSGNCPTGFPCN